MDEAGETTLQTPDTRTTLRRANTVLRAIDSLLDDESTEAWGQMDAKAQSELYHLIDRVAYGAYGLKKKINRLTPITHTPKEGTT